MNLEAFNHKLKAYLRLAGRTQGHLATELGLDPTVLSRKLKGSTNRRFSTLEIKQVVGCLAKWGIIFRQAEASELLELAGAPPFEEQDWHKFPLNRLLPTLPSPGQVAPPPNPNQLQSLSNPSGQNLVVVTLLLTEIENINQHWEHSPLTTKVALELYKTAMLETLKRYQGNLFGQFNSTFYSCFDQPNPALEAAKQAQLTFLSQKWPASEGKQSKVKMVLYTCQLERDGEHNFRGAGLSRAEQLLRIANGGQILVSASTRELVADQLGAGLGLQYLGRHWFANLTYPEQLYQLTGAGLPQSFAPLQTRSEPLHNLPLELTSFVGRELQLSQLRERLAQSGLRLLTLLGTGGAGKTRLALEVAAQVRDKYLDGVWLVELGLLSDPVFISQAIGQAVSLPDEPPNLGKLIEFLRPRQLLIVLDNCEHLVEECARVAEKLLQGCPRLQILATSRESLNIRGEHLFVVPPLTLPPAHETSLLPSGSSSSSFLTVLEIEKYEAIQLFTERLKAIDATFTLTPQTGPVITEICRHLDGLPLALELAVANSRTIPLTKLNHQLEKRFELLTGPNRTAPPRQQTLGALLDWSYELLSELEQTCFRRLTVFKGGFSEEEAVVIVEGQPLLRQMIPLLLTQLVSKSLLSIEEAGEQRHYRFLETIREYGLERLAHNQEEAQQTWQKAFVYLSQRGDKCVGQSRYIEARQYYAESLIALSYFKANRSTRLEWVDTVIKLASTFFVFVAPHQILAYLHQAEKIMIELKAEAEEVEPNENKRRLARIHFWLGHAYNISNKTNEGFGYYQKVLEEAQALGDPELLAIPSYRIGQFFVVQGNFRQALPLLEQASRYLKELKRLDEWQGAVAWYGYTLVNLAQVEAGLQEVNRALEWARQTGNLLQLAVTNTIVAWSQLLNNQPGLALEASQAGTSYLRERNELFTLFLALQPHILASSRLGYHEAAQHSLAEAQQLVQRLGGNLIGLETLLVVEAEVKFNAGQYEEAIRVAQQVVGMSQTSGMWHEAGKAHRIWGLALAAPGSKEQAEILAHLEASEKAFEQGNAVLELARTRAVLNRYRVVEYSLD